MVDEGDPPLSTRDAVVVGACLCLAWGLKVAVKSTLTTLRRSNDASQPLVVVRDEFFDATDAIALEECAASAAAEAQNVLGELFEHSRSVAVSFNEAGIARLRTTPDFACLAPYFDAARDSRANAWVLNVLVCEAGAASPVHWHVDQTVALRVPLARFAAHAVDVWYARVPDDLVGGELELMQFSQAWLDRHAMRSFKPHTKRSQRLKATIDWTAVVRDDDLVRRVEPDAAAWNGSARGAIARALVTPRRNARVTFRGDAFHQVRPFASANDTCQQRSRVSIVLEQYRIPYIHYWNTVSFHLAL